jgi:hypothetical protein
LLEKEKLNISSIRKFLATHFGAGAYFATQLMAEEINVLDQLWDQHSAMFEQQIKHIITHSSLSAAQLRHVLTTLQQHHYIELQESIPCVGSPRFTRLKIIDSVFCSVKIDSDNAWMTAEEWVFEDVVRALLNKHKV